MSLDFIHGPPYSYGHVEGALLIPCHACLTRRRAYAYDPTEWVECLFWYRCFENSEVVFPTRFMGFHGLSILIQSCCVITYLCAEITKTYSLCVLPAGTVSASFSHQPQLGQASHRLLQTTQPVANGDIFESLGLAPGSFPSTSPNGDAFFNRTALLADFTTRIYEANPQTFCFLLMQILVNGSQLLPFNDTIRQVGPSPPFPPLLHPLQPSPSYVPGFVVIQCLATGCPIPPIYKTTTKRPEDFETPHKEGLGTP